MRVRMLFLTLLAVGLLFLSLTGTAFARTVVVPNDASVGAANANAQQGAVLLVPLP